MSSKLIVTLKSGRIGKFDDLEHHVDVAGDLIIGGTRIKCTDWASVHIEEVSPKPKKKAKSKEEVKIESK